MFNQPGRLEQVRPLAGAPVVLGLHEVHLIFNSSDGRRCAIYAALALPDAPGPHALIIHLPGGGQTVATADLHFWTARGFACASLDWQNGLFDHDHARKSVWPSGVVCAHEPLGDWRQAIIPLAVETVGVVIDWAATFSDIDVTRVGLTGISWGGYLTWVVNAHEPRLRAAVPVYGCGGLFADHPCRPPIPADVGERWRRDWEPSALAAQQLSPVSFLNGSNDFFGWLRDGDPLMDALTVPRRRSYAPNLDHAVTPEQSALAVAWMRQWLCGGATVPDEPRYDGKRLVVDERQPISAIEPWWSPSTCADDSRCWWPGEAPAAARWRLTLVRYASGLVLSTAVTSCAPTTHDLLPDLWPDLRAGLGWRWNLGGTQLHGNDTRVAVLTDDSTRVRIVSERTSAGGVILRQLADPRWNHGKIQALRLRVESATAIITLRVAIRWADGSTRHEASGLAPVSTDGWLTIAPALLSWWPVELVFAAVMQLIIDDIPAGPFVLGPLERVRAESV